MRKAVLAAFTCCLAWGQGADKSLTFDAASVKPADMPKPDGRGRIFMAGPSGGPGTKDPGRIHYPFMSLKQLLETAYDVKNYQIVGPAWLDSERFEISATMPPETTKEQFRVMLQNLLAERFKMVVHKDTKELPMYALEVAKNGPKLTESDGKAQPLDPDGPPPPLPAGGPKIGPDGFPQLPFSGRAGLFMMMMPGRARMVGTQQSMQDLANRLANQFSKAVVDETGLTKKYDFTLTFLPDGMNGPMGPMPPPPAGGGAAGGTMVAVAPAGAGAAPGAGAGGGAPGGGDPANVSRPEGEAPPDIFHALQAQLGLRLESKKGPVEIVVIDHMEKTPTEN